MVDESVKGKGGKNPEARILLTVRENWLDCSFLAVGIHNVIAIAVLFCDILRMRHQTPVMISTPQME